MMYNPISGHPIKKSVQGLEEFANTVSAEMTLAVLAVPHMVKKVKSREEIPCFSGKTTF